MVSSKVFGALLLLCVGLTAVSCSSDTTTATLPATTLELSATSFTATLHAATDSTIVSLAVANGSTTPVTWSASASAPWIGLKTTNGSTPAAVIITLKAAGLAPGIYTGTITVTGDNVTNSPLTVSVNLTVSGQPALAVSTDSLRFLGVVGAPDPGSQSITIANTGTGNLSWTASSSDSWITVSPVSGTGGGAVTVSVHTTNLAAGTMHGTVTIAAPDATGSPVLVPITLVLSTP